MMGVLSLAVFSNDDDDTPQTDENTDLPPTEPATPTTPPTPTAPVTPTDPVSPIDGPDPLATDGDDTLTGTSEDERFNGLEGNDLIDGRGGSDTLFGDAGDDTILGGRSDDLIGGSDGNDSLAGEQGRDTVYGGEGDDFLAGNGGEDRLDGEEGNDRLEGGGGSDTLHGEAGLDTLIGGNGDDNLYDYDIPFNEGALNTSVMDGGAGNDTLQFDDGSTVTGGLGADSLFLYDALDDTLVSRITDFDPAEDFLRVAVNVTNETTGGDFRLEARSDGTGNDLYLGDDLIAEIQSTSSFDLEDITLVVLLEQDAGPVAFTGGAADLDIEGNHSDNTVTGGDGDERIIMDGFYEFTLPNYNGGSDSVDGGAGNDTITGSGVEFFQTDVDDGNMTFLTFEQDTLNGDAGDDVIISRNGNILTGGSGADIFAMRQDNSFDTETGAGVPAAIITDFNPTEDSIVLSPITVPDPSALVFVPFPDGTGSTIELGDQIIARVTVTNGQAIGLDNINTVQFFTDLVRR